jgi:hypothetical protein
MGCFRPAKVLLSQVFGPEIKNKNKELAIAWGMAAPTYEAVA